MRKHIDLRVCETCSAEVAYFETADIRARALTAPKWITVTRTNVSNSPIVVGTLGFMQELDFCSEDCFQRYHK